METFARDRIGGEPGAPSETHALSATSLGWSGEEAKQSIALQILFANKARLTSPQLFTIHQVITVIMQWSLLLLASPPHVASGNSGIKPLLNALNKIEPEC